MEVDSPSLLTIKLQVAFDEATVDQQVEIERENHVRNSKINSLLEDIVATKPRGAAASEALYRKVHAYVAMHARLDATDAGSMRAAAAALESVLPRGEIGALAALAPKPKAAQLQELANIVTGILVFNMATNRSAAFVDDGTIETSRSSRVLDTDLRLACTVGTTYRALSEELLNALAGEEQLIQQDISDLTLVLNHSFVIGRQPPLGADRLQAELTLRRQYEQVRVFSL
jgi:hypothetical protein